ncbi:MAG: hypothetical protein AB7M12_08025 [Hyphomonadaceae bacterium]
MRVLFSFPVLSLALCALAACGPQAPQQGAGPASSAPPSAVASAAPPPAAPIGPPRFFDAMSNTAMSFTDALEVDDLGQARARFSGKTGLVYEGEQAAKSTAGAMVGGMALTALLPTAPAGAPLAIYRVTSEQIGPKAPNGGFCAPDKTGLLAVVEYAAADGAREMQVAAFKDSAWPPKTLDGLCGTFGYAERKSAP